MLIDSTGSRWSTTRSVTPKAIGSSHSLGDSFGARLHRGDVPVWRDELVIIQRRGAHPMHVAEVVLHGWRLLDPDHHAEHRHRGPRRRHSMAQTFARPTARCTTRSGKDAIGVRMHGVTPVCRSRPPPLVPPPECASATRPPRWRRTADRVAHCRLNHEMGGSVAQRLRSSRLCRFTTETVAQSTQSKAASASAVPAVARAVQRAGSWDTRGRRASGMRLSLASPDRCLAPAAS